MQPVLVRLEAVETFERPVRLRLPFRFGIVVLREAPQVLVRVRINDNSGRSGQGIAAEMLAPKWFDKNPDLSNEQNFDQLRDSIRIATELYLESPRPLTPFELSMNCYRSQLQEGDGAGLNPLLAVLARPSWIEPSWTRPAAWRKSRSGRRSDTIFPACARTQKSKISATWIGTSTCRRCGRCRVSMPGIQWGWWTHHEHGSAPRGKGCRWSSRDSR